jgi:TRAP-type C4-dicarboxylate transport system substrate-binding protein
MLLVPLFAGCSKSKPAEETIEIKYIVPPRGIIGEEVATVKQWMDSVENATNGRVKFNVLVGATTDPDAYDALIAGTGDLASNLMAMTPGRFPIMEMMTVCDIGTTCKHPSQVAWDLWKKYPEQINKEFSDIQPLCFWAAAPAPIGLGFATVDKPIRTLADAKGMKMGQASEFGIKTAAALGMAPVPAPPPALYENLQRKIIDGTFMDPEMMDAFKLSELLRYYHAVNFQFMPFWLGMNKEAWSKLPEDIQKTLQEEAAKIPAWADAYHTEAAKRALESAKEKYGLEVVEIAPEEVERWAALQEPIQQEYMDRLAKQKGIDTKAIFKTLDDLYQKYDQ